MSRPSLRKRGSDALECSSPSASPTRESKRLKACPPTPTLTTVLGDGPNANKENIPPFRDGTVDRELATATPGGVRLTRGASRRAGDIATRRASTSASFDRPSVAPTPPETPSRRDASEDDVEMILGADEEDRTPLPAPQFTAALKTPARELGALSLATPPATPPLALQARARALLRSTTDCFSVIGRETEAKVVRNFLAPFLSDETTDADSSVPTSLYISGSPGTGKTALVTSVINATRADELRTAYINCMGLKDINVLWGRVLSSLGEAGTSNRSRASASSLHRFERKLAEPDFKCILVFDELDAFDTSALSSIFGLPARFPASIRIIAISNDLTQSTASPTLAIHRPSLTLAFSAYNAAEMQEIIRARLALLATSPSLTSSSSSSTAPLSQSSSASSNTAIDKKSEAEAIAKIIQPAALTLLVKKVSSQTGDIRQALEVLRRAIELATPPSSLEADNEKKDEKEKAPTPVGMKHVIDAVKRSAAKSANNGKSPIPFPGHGAAGNGAKGPLDDTIASLGLQARLVLVTILVARRRAAHGLPLDSLSSSSSFASSSFSFTPSTPSKSKTPSTPSKSKIRRTTSLGAGSSSSSINIDTQLGPSRVYSLYGHVLRACPSAPFEVVSRSEYTDLLGVLETSSLVSVPSVCGSPSKSCFSPTKSPSKRARKVNSFGGGGVGIGGGDEGGIVLCANEDEVLRALLATAGSGEGAKARTALDEEVGRIWERETRRVEKALKEERRIREEGPKEAPLDREDYL